MKQWGGIKGHCGGILKSNEEALKGNEKSVITMRMRQRAIERH